MNPKEKIKFISNWIKSYAEGMPSKAQSLVIGISGGIDSSVSSTYVLETDESIPPEIPITKDCAFEGIPSA